MKILMTLLLLPMAAFAQEGQAVNQVDGPPPSPYQAVNGYSGTNIIYRCSAKSVITTGTRPSISTAISAATNASPVVFTSTGHGFPIPSQLVVRPKITISGGTGNWTAINREFTATIIDANTFSIPVDSTAFGALTGTIRYTTTAPRLNQPEWSVELFTYDGSNNNLGNTWLAGVSSLSTKCSDATSTNLNVQ